MEERIVGERIFIRPITDEDTDLVVAWRNKESVRHNFIYRGAFTAEGHREWLRTKVATGKVVQFMIGVKETEELVGSVYLRDVDYNCKKAEYGIFIGADDATGKGYGTEAARMAVAYARDVLKLHKVILRVYADNGGAVRSYEKAGFVQEAYLKDEVKIDGVYRDIILMAQIFKENQ